MTMLFLEQLKISKLSDLPGKTIGVFLWKHSEGTYVREVG